ncbi:MarR family winged helix-turn-helix transcriptional regulator [Caballeronia mineralivorans]|jgi:DNA-binding MarR family transcriptional regulator|uniref:MarR family winged helix-turn-helix transcriptional regulator n=1 Tax=Caballeronia mineralivorans TaxID=2010198 RepID=UPI0023F4E7C3|nr:MarR family winged helix-turn-helix transcriptional regulator [Caballeronia mineralivorans]MDB5780162.1 MarR family transcriptional regulator [Caballeronia mineralivorans]
MKNRNVIEGLFTYRLHVLKKQTDRTMNQAFTDEIALTLTEARVLLSVGSFGTLSVSDLGKASNLDRSQASRATDILERKGLVEKTSSATDGRGVVVTLTAKGKRTYTRAAAIAKARNDDILATLGQAEREALGKILAKLIAAQGDDETAG